MTRRLLTLSAFAAGLFAVAAFAQPPAGEKGGGKKADAKKADAPVPDTAIEAALANDPDVRMARAKMQLAEAEWVKARQAVAAKVLTLRSQIADQKRMVNTIEESFALLRAGFDRNQVSRSEMLTAREKLEAAQANLARSEMELKLVTGGGGVPAAHGVLACPAAMKGATNCTACHVMPGGFQGVVADRLDASAALVWLGAKVKAPTGPVTDRLRTALDQPVRIGEKGKRVAFDKAMEAFRAAGLDVPVRPLPSALEVATDGEELPIGAWLQLYQDMAAMKGEGFAFYVREYGLLVADKQTAPPDAPTLTEFWKQPKAAEPKK
jgi:hypothetical protein